MRRADRSLAGIEGGSDGAGRCLSIPVVAGWNNGLAAKALAGETEIVGGEASIWANDIPEVAGDTVVKSDTASRSAAQIIWEAAEASCELLEYDSLSLNLANLLGDDPELNFYL